MDFRNLLDDRLEKLSRFFGVRCGQCIEEHGRFGYELDGAAGGPGLSKVIAGISIASGCIIGIYYVVGNKIYQTGLHDPKYLNELDAVLDLLAQRLDEDLSVGSKDYVMRSYERAVPAVVNNSNDILRFSNGKLCTIVPVLATMGYDADFYTMAMAQKGEVCIFSLLKQQNGVYVAEWELSFPSKVEGNSFYRRVKHSSFVSKKGRTIYKVELDDFRKFSKVKGEEFILGR